MGVLSGSEMLFYGGLAAMACSVLGAAVSGAAFRSAGKRLKEILEREYGKCLR